MGVALFGLLTIFTKFPWGDPFSPSTLSFNPSPIPYLYVLQFKFDFSGDQNHGSPMMPQSIRSQTPVGAGGMPNQMLPNNPAQMSQMRMAGSQMQVK